MKLGVIGAAITAALLGAFAVVATPTTAPVAAVTAAPLPTDCKRVAVADRALCTAVYRQRAYGWTTPAGDPQNWVPNGKALVKEITHQGLTKAEMHSYLTGAQFDYRFYVTDVSFNVDGITKHCGHHRGAGSVQEIKGRDGHLYTWKVIVCD
jgi:hypothetical protein